MNMQLGLGAVMVGCAAAQSAWAQCDPGRVIWRTQTPGHTSVRQFLARATDGAVYTADNSFTYAVSPGGAIVWSAPEASGDHFGARPISIGDGGVLFTGVSPFGEPYRPVIALNPDGSVRWRFDPGPGLDGNLACGPSVGPDGLVYAVQEVRNGNGLGAFALTQEGQLVWSNAGDPVIGPADLITTSEVEFGADRMHAGVIHLRSGGNPAIYTLSLAGQQLWTSWEFAVHTTTFPVIDPSNRVILPWGQTGMRAVSPDGQEQWHVLHPGGASVTTRPAVDAAGVIYTGDVGGLEQWAINPDGSTRWVQPPRMNTALAGMALPPDGHVLLAWGSVAGKGTIWALDPATGEELWCVQFEPEMGRPLLILSYEPVFTPDSETAYFTLQFAGSGTHGYVVAIRLGQSGCYANCDSSAAAPIANVADFTCFLQRFASGDPFANCDQSTTAPVLNVADFTCFLQAFAAGCP